MLSSALPVIAKWYRRRVAQGLCAPVDACDGRGPKAVIRAVARSVEGQAFIRRTVDRLCQRASASVEGAHELGTAASLAWTLGDVDLAFQTATAALDILTRHAEVPLADESLAELTAFLLRLGRQRDILCMARELPEPARWTPRTIPEVDARSLSCADFWELARNGRPVVLRSLAHDIFRQSAVTWSIAGLLAACMRDDAVARDLSRNVVLKQHARGSVEWAGLEELPASRTISARAHLEALLERPAEGGGVPGYLFDWSLPLNAPSLLAGVRIPKFFANDFLQRYLPPGALYRESWPSLFLGPARSSCGLHVDTCALHFWCAQLEGKKRWVLFNREQLHALGASYELHQDPVFPPETTAFVDELQATPMEELLAGARPSSWAGRPSPMVCELHPGDVIFVPSGMPHAVQNLDEPVLSVSANYVDETCLTAVLREVGLAALTDSRAGEVLQRLQGAERQKGDRMTAFQDHVTFEAFKGMPGAPPT